MGKAKISEIRQEVMALGKQGKAKEAKRLWKQGVAEMYAGTIEDDENITSKPKLENIVPETKN